MTNTKSPDQLPAASLNALIIGDAMVDTYLDSNPVGISDEAPVLVLDWVNTVRTFGGMLNTATTLAALGFETHALGVVNETDEAGRFVDEECTRLGINQHWTCDGRPTIEKARVRTNPAHPPLEQLARIDDEWDTPLDDAAAGQLVERFDELGESADVIVVSDYCKSVLTQAFAGHLVETARARKIPIVVDAKPGTLAWYAGATLLTPNEAEARAFANEVFGENEAAEFDRATLAARLAEHLKAGILLTCASAGLYLHLPSESAAGPVHIPASEVDYIESTSGAGDVVLAVMALAAARREPFVNGAGWACRAVGRTLTRKGTCALTSADLALLTFD